MFTTVLTKHLPMTSTPVYHSAVNANSKRPHVVAPTEYGNPASFWVEYPSGLVDLTRTNHLPTHDNVAQPPPPLVSDTQFEVSVDCDRVLRLNKAHTAIVIVDMQKYASTFLFHATLQPKPSQRCPVA